VEARILAPRNDVREGVIAASQSPDHSEGEARQSHCDLPTGIASALSCSATTKEDGVAAEIRPAYSFSQLSLSIPACLRILESNSLSTGIGAFKTQDLQISD
jgi:hypothetical protein